MKQEVVTFKGQQILITTDWTGRRVTVTGTNQRSAAISRPLATELWNISFYVQWKKSQSEIKVPSVSKNFDALLLAAKKFIVDSILPSNSEFGTIDALILGRKKLIGNIAAKLKKQANRPVKSKSKPKCHA